MIDLGNDTHSAEIAFFGGSFTAIDRDYMVSLLEATKPYIDSFYGIRISTRPDCIDDSILSLLKQYKVTSIELGAQSMDDIVLSANNRGHSSADAVYASKLIKSYGFSLGLQMMTGLYRSTVQTDISTAEQFIALMPDTVRIYPTVVMRDTELESLYNNQVFLPYSLEESIELCSKLIEMFEDNNINIIRLGLHYSDSLIKNSIGNNYHPAFKELCENRIFYNKFYRMAQESDGFNTVFINQRSLSKFLGQKKSNLSAFEKLGYKFDIKFDNTLPKYDLYLK